MRNKKFCSLARCILVYLLKTIEVKFHNYPLFKSNNITGGEYVVSELIESMETFQDEVRSSIEAIQDEMKECQEIINKLVTTSSNNKS